MLYSSPLPAAVRPAWVQVADGFWTATGAGVFIGTVDRLGGRFEARDATGVLIRRAERLDDAQRAVARHDGAGYRRRRLTGQVRHQIARPLRRARRAARSISHPHYAALRSSPRGSTLSRLRAPGGIGQSA